MNRRKLIKTFKRIQKEMKFDYALTEGMCCPTCTWQEIAGTYNKDACGIWLGWFREGMNKSIFSKQDVFYIKHDAPLEVLDKVCDILREEGYAVEWERTEVTSIRIEEINND